MALVAGKVLVGEFQFNTNLNKQTHRGITPAEK